MLTQKHIQIIQLITRSLAKSDIIWAFTGSTSFNLQGIDFPPSDIDIQTNQSGAYQIEEIFHQYSIKPVQFSTTETIRSHFGTVNIQGISVEIMGDIEKYVDNNWGTPPNLVEHRQFISIYDLQIPVLSLQYEVEAYRKMGRIQKADMLQAYLRKLQS